MVRTVLFPQLSVLVLLVLLVLLAGCGGRDHPAVYPVSGTVVYADQPVSAALVTFHGDHAPRLATGTTDAEGRFQLSTFGRNDGAVPGRHVVTISKMEIDDPADANLPGDSMDDALQNPGGVIQAVHQLPDRYADPGRSDLQVTVSDSEENVFAFVLE